MTNGPDVTALLVRWKAGDEAALDQLLPLVYGSLRELAARQLRGESAGHTLQPTALVHEAYLKILGSDPGRVESRVHFLALAAKAMRQILIDHARRRAAEKRAGGLQRVALTDALAEPGRDGPREVDALALDEALRRLETFRPRAAQVVELRYFGGLTLEEAAEILEVTSKTVSREWNTARLWLSTACLRRRLIRPAANRPIRRPTRRAHPVHDLCDRAERRQRAEAACAGGPVDAAELLAVLMIGQAPGRLRGSR